MTSSHNKKLTSSLDKSSSQKKAGLILELARQQAADFEKGIDELEALLRTEVTFTFPQTKRDETSELVKEITVPILFSASKLTSRIFSVLVGFDCCEPMELGLDLVASLRTFKMSPHKDLKEQLARVTKTQNSFKKLAWKYCIHDWHKKAEEPELILGDPKAKAPPGSEKNKSYRLVTKPDRADLPKDLIEADLPEGLIEFECEGDRFHYRVVGLNQTIETGSILFSDLSREAGKEFPTPLQIQLQQKELLPTILHFTAEARHTKPYSREINIGDDAYQDIVTHFGDPKPQMFNKAVVQGIAALLKEDAFTRVLQRVKERSAADYHDFLRALTVDSEIQAALDDIKKNLASSNQEKEKNAQEKLAEKLTNLHAQLQITNVEEIQDQLTRILDEHTKDLAARNRGKSTASTASSHSTDSSNGSSYSRSASPSMLPPRHTTAPSPSGSHEHHKHVEEKQHGFLNSLAALFHKKSSGSGDGESRPSSPTVSGGSSTSTPSRKR